MLANSLGGREPALEAGFPLAKEGRRVRMRLHLSPQRQLDKVELLLERRRASYLRWLQVLPPVSRPA